MDLARGIDCRACRVAHYEADKDPPCDELQEDPETGELAHRCKFGLVELWPENWQAAQAWRYLRVMGPEAGLRLLETRIGPDGLAQVAEELVLLQGQQNLRDKERAQNPGKG